MGNLHERTFIFNFFWKIFESAKRAEKGELCSLPPVDSIILSRNWKIKMRTICGASFKAISPSNPELRPIKELQMRGKFWKCIRPQKTSFAPFLGFHSILLNCKWKIKIRAICGASFKVISPSDLNLRLINDFDMHFWTVDYLLNFSQEWKFTLKYLVLQLKSCFPKWPT